MSPAPSVARHEHAGRLEPLRLGLRYSADHPPPRDPQGVIGPIALAEGALSPGTQRFGPFEIAVALDAGDDVAAIDTVVRNLADAPLHVEALVVGFRWHDADASATRFLRHGWQSWSNTVGRELDGAGEPPFPSGPWLRGMHHCVGQAPDDRTGWHESALVSVAEDAHGRVCLAGVIEQGLGSGVVYWQRDAHGIRVEVEIRVEAPLAPGASLELEQIHLALGQNADRLLENYAHELGQANGARTAGPFQAGWCSWYQFFHAVSEEDLLRNLEALTRRRAEIPIDVVQLDDGYQRAVGDWLETNEKFPRGLAPLAQEIRAAGFRAGIWTAPFCVAPESRLFESHPEWLLRQGDTLHRGLVHREWSASGDIHVLDTSRDDVTRHLMRTAAALAGMGFSYQKLDFLYTAAMQADAADPAITRARRLRRGLEAIREGAGDETFLLGCGCPIGPAVGIVDGMRIGADTAPHWHVRGESVVRGLEPALPAVANALRGIQTRAWMHRRLWQNDPDCLMVRTRDTELSADEATTLAGAIALSGGMVMLSDDVAGLTDDETKRIREVIAMARDVDAGGEAGATRAIGLLEESGPSGLLARTPSTVLAQLTNTADGEANVEASLAASIPERGPLPPEPLFGTRDPEPRDDGVLRASLPSHASLLVRATGEVRLAIFCDYDGTFAVQDVGSTLAMRHAGDRREQLWPRLVAGEFTPWSYNMELLDGLRLPEETLDAFLKTVEPMPGAHELVAWCEAHAIPFRILSDGFDRNLDRLQELHGVRFAYDANRLWYDQGAWRLAPGSPDPSCDCGTGVCKAARIRELRAIHPQATVVHIGNGRVSDLCGARAADVVFAKDSLAEELETQGVAYEPFEDLHQVLVGLEALRQRLA
jgi:alpha-galactosidase